MATAFVSPGRGQSVVHGQGSARAEGAGVILDGNGSDTYSSVAERLGSSTFQEITLIVQAATGDLGGVAVLFDLGAGTDKFFSRPRGPACGGQPGDPYWQGCGDGVAFGFNP